MHTLLRVGVLHAHLRLQPVRVPEEQAEDVPEVGDESIGRLASQQPLPDLIERVDRRRLQCEMVESSSTEHRDLACMLRVAVHLEDVEFYVRSDPHERQLEAFTILQHLMRHLEDVTVERKNRSVSAVSTATWLMPLRSMGEFCRTGRADSCRGDAGGRSWQQ